MPDTEVLRSYLVSLGFSTDMPSFRRYESMLKDAETAAERHTSGITATLLKAQGLIASGFLAVSGSIIGLADHVAMADQGYRLFGLRMMMTQTSAKHLQIALDSLGVTMEQAVWDREVHGRVLKSIRDQVEMEHRLGDHFSKNMIGIRDLRAEFASLQVAANYLGQAFTSDLFEKLGINGDKLTGWVGYLEKHFPELANKLSDQAIPVLKQTWHMLGSMGEAAKEFGVLFTNTTGLLSGDKSIQGTEFSFDKLVKAVGDASAGLGKFVDWTTDAEKSLLHFIDAGVLALDQKWKPAWKEFQEGMEKVTPKGTGITTALVVGKMAGPAAGIAAGVAAFGVVNAVKGITKAYETESPRQATNDIFLAPYTLIGRGLVDVLRKQLGGDQNFLGTVAGLARKAGADTGINPKLIFEQWAFETGNFTSRATQLNNLAGIRLPGSTEYQRFGSLSDFEKRYAEVLKLPRYAGLLGVKNEEEMATVFKRGGYYDPKVDAKTYSGGMRRFGSEYMQYAAPQQNITVNVGGVHVTHPNATPDQVTNAVETGVANAMRRQTQKDLAQLNPE